MKVNINQDYANSLGISNEHRAHFIAAMMEELNKAYAKHGCEAWSRHEMYAILQEEVDEVWDNIKCNGDKDNLIKELIQVACVCLRYAESIDRYSKKRFDLPFPVNENYENRIEKEDNK